MPNGFLPSPLPCPFESPQIWQLPFSPPDGAITGITLPTGASVGGKISPNACVEQRFWFRGGYRRLGPSPPATPFLSHNATRRATIKIMSLSVRDRAGSLGQTYVAQPRYAFSHVAARRPAPLQSGLAPKNHPSRRQPALLDPARARAADGRSCAGSSSAGQPRAAAPPPGPSR
jgi:hypothetical protein